MTSTLNSSTPLRDLMKQIVRAPSRSSRDTRSAASANAERRVPSRSSVIGGFHTAMRLAGAGEASRSTRLTGSRPVRRSASSTGLAIVAEVSTKRGSVP